MCNYQFHFFPIVSSLELLPIVLAIPGVKLFITDKINQDPLEKVFGRLYQHGRANQNPTVAEALKSTQTLRVVDSVWVDDLAGSNCRGRKRKRKFLETEDCKPLPKRRKRRPSM